MKQVFATISILAVIGLMSPSAGFTQSIRPGTDDFLRDRVGLSEEQLSTPSSTENREVFNEAIGVGALQDPVGDVLNRVGVSTTLQLPFTDLESVELIKKEQIDEWVVEYHLADSIPSTISSDTLINIYFYADIDPESENEYEGIGAGMDAEWRLKLNREEGWVKSFRWYNEPVDFWARDRETKMRFEVAPEKITLHIPFSEFPNTEEPHWRAMMAGARGNDSSIDVVPQIGFPPPKGEIYPTVSFGGNRLALWTLIGTGALVLVFTTLAIKKK